MTLLLILRSRNYQYHTRTTFIPALLLILGISTASMSWPAKALAFEVSDLRVSEIPTVLLSQLPVISEATPEGAGAVYTYTSIGIAVARPSTITQSGTWPQQPKKTKSSTPLTASVQPLVPTTTDALLILEGEASYYSRAGCLGCNPLRIMANGQPLNDAALTMAIGADRKHFVGRVAKVTNLATGQSIAVRITDTGGFHHQQYGSRVADLTIATKQAIGMAGGVGKVRVEVY